MNIHRVNPTHEHIDLIYYATSDTDDVIPENKDDQWKWLSREEVQSHPLLTEKIRRYALGALGALQT